MCGLHGMGDLPLFGAEPLPMFGEAMPFTGREMPGISPNFAGIEKKLFRQNMPASIVTNPPRANIPGLGFFGRGIPGDPRTSSLPANMGGIPGQQFAQFAQKDRAPPRASRRTTSLKNQKSPKIKPRSPKKPMKMFGA